VNVDVRPLALEDIDAACDIQTRSFEDVDRRLGEPVEDPTPTAVARQRRRMTHFLEHDPAGAFVACAEGRLAGVALALRRDDLWGLSLLAIEPDLQGRGIGRQLLAATLRYGDDATTGVILSSRDPRALAAYADAGFDLHPQVVGVGVVDRRLLPSPSARVRPGADARVADAVDRSVRGASRGADHDRLAEAGASYLVDDAGGRGYAYTRGGFVAALAATDDDTATALLWACLEGADGEVRVGHVTGAQQWAVRVTAAARLRMTGDGAAFWRGRQPPPSYLPSGAYL
jgi:GNAT superfamily N-acetyltransferase